jgi:hypothetical protein
MNELEVRLASLELLLIELMADADALRLSHALDRIRAGIPEAVDEREATARRQAVQHIEDALKRHDLLTTSSIMRRPPTSECD